MNRAASRAACCNRRGDPEATHSVVFRKSDGGVVITHHDSRDAALETAADVRAAFPWLQVNVVQGNA